MSLSVPFIIKLAAKEFDKRDILLALFVITYLSSKIYFIFKNKFNLITRS